MVVVCSLERRQFGLQRGEFGTSPKPSGAPKGAADSDYLDGDDPLASSDPGPRPDGGEKSTGDPRPGDGGDCPGPAAAPIVYQTAHVEPVCAPSAANL